jgi:hypothetical protein
MNPILLAFFLGLLSCALLLQAFELINGSFEAKRRIEVARIRGTVIPAIK